MPADSRVVLGQVAGAFGVQGWVRIHSYTRPIEQIIEYPNWHLSGQAYELIEGRSQGNAIVAKLQGVGDRDAALALLHRDIEVDRALLPVAEPGEFYWTDLIGCVARNVAGAELGKVMSLFSTGAQDVLVVRGERERLIPFVQGPIVKSVDLDAKTIVLDWELDY